MNTTSRGRAAFAAILLALAAAASAAPRGAAAIVLEPATVPCEAAIAGLVGGSNGCQRSLSFASDEATGPGGLSAVNAEAFFGSDRWDLLGRIEGVDLPDRLAGTYDLGEGIYDSYARVLLVLAGGPGTFVVGYLLEEVVSGGWASPFLASVFPDAAGAEVARIAFYGLGSTGAQPTETPVPASLSLLLAGLGALAALRGGGGGRRAASA